MRPALLAALLLALAPACRTAKAAPDAPRADRPTPTTRAFTTAFQHEAVLVADEIVIEGPSDLIGHIVLRQDPDTTVYTTKTVTEGLLQELASRSQSPVEVRGQLDAWSLAAFKKITVLQRPGDVPVSVTARGNAYWAAGDGSGEKRGASLTFQGVHER